QVLEVLEEQFPVVLSKIAFLVQIKARHNNEYNSSDVRRAFCFNLATKIKEWNCDFVPELKEPELVVNIDILKKICCISLLPHFGRFKKYNPEQFNVARYTQPSKDSGDDQSKPTKADTSETSAQQSPSTDAANEPQEPSPAGAFDASKDNDYNSGDSRKETLSS
ncbi:THUMP domain-containing protein 1-like, partial [Tropilaelaps mercedesae]